MTVVRYADPPIWRIIVTDLDGALVTILDQRSTDRTFNFVLNGPAVHSGLVASDDPEINIPYPSADDPAFVSNNTRLLFGLRRETGGTPIAGKAALFDASAGPAYLTFELPAPESEVWLTFECWLTAANLAAIKSTYNYIANTDYTTTPTDFSDGVQIADDAGDAVWASGAGAITSRVVTPLECHLVELRHDEGALVSNLFVDGEDFGLNAVGAFGDTVMVTFGFAGIAADDPDTQVIISHPMIGTSRGAGDILDDDFGDNTFDAWTAVVGDVTIIDGPCSESSAAAPYVCRSGKIIMQCEDVAADTPTTRYTAYDPWQLLFARPCRTDAGALPPAEGITYTDARPSDIAYDLLANTVAVDGPVFIDASDLSLIQESEILFGDFKVERGASVGEIWQRLCDTGYIDIILRPVYEPRTWGTGPVNVVELVIRKRAGDLQADAVFAWDLPSRSITEGSRMVDGTRLINTIRAYAGQGGDPVTTQTDADSIAKYGVYWSQPFYVEAVGQDIVAESLALSELLTRRNGQRTLTFSPAPEFSPLSLRDYGLGDYVPVWASRHLREPLGVDYAAYISDPDNPGAAGYQRISEIPLELDDNGVERVRGIVTQNEQNS